MKDKIVSDGCSDPTRYLVSRVAAHVTSIAKCAVRLTVKNIGFMTVVK